MKNKIQTTGFTVIELLVVIVTISLIFGTGIAAYNEFNQRQQVVQAGNLVIDSLRLAQNKAISGDKDCTATTCGGDGSGNCQVSSKSLDGWFVDFANHQIYGQCEGVQFGNTALSTPFQVNISFTGPSLVKFSPLNSTATVTTICLSKFSKFNYKINVTNVGEIKDGGIVASCP